MITQQDLEREKPIVVTLDAQEIGYLYVGRATPYDYQQYYLRKLKNAGAPIEGLVHLRPSYGVICRVKESIQGPGHFDFMWVPPAWAAAINQSGGLDDGTPMGKKMPVVG